MMTYWGYNNYYSTYGIWGTIVFVLVWVIIIGLVIEVVRAIVGHSRHHNTPQQPTQPVIPPTTVITTGTHQSEKSALDILNERYAKGEINKEEYEQKKADMKI